MGEKKSNKGGTIASLQIFSCSALGMDSNALDVPNYNQVFLWLPLPDEDQEIDIKLV